MPILNEEVPVSVNMWAGAPDFLDYLEEGFMDFLSNLSDKPTKAEYLLPIIDGLLKHNKATVKVMKTPDKWIGITYAEDTALAQQGFKDMVEKGVYNVDLWSE